MKWLRLWMVFPAVFLTIAVWQFIPRAGGPGAFTPIAGGSPYEVPTSSPTAKIIDPVSQFKDRITKKNFGQYITPKKSPVSPEKFSGYHPGADVEDEDVTDDVPVVAVANGQVVASKYASGYGGVMVIRHVIEGRELFGVCGHLRATSMLPVARQGETGGQMG